MKRSTLLVFGLLIFLISGAQPPVASYPSNNSIRIPVSAKLAWSAVSGATRYQVQVDVLQAFSSAGKLDFIVSSPSKEIGDLEFDKKHYWRIRTIKNTDTSAWSSTYNFTTINAFYPSSPVNNALNNRVFFNLVFLRMGCRIELEYDTAALFDSPVKRDTVLLDTAKLSSSSNLTFRMQHLHFGKKFYVRARGITATDTLPFATFFTGTTTAAGQVFTPANGSTTDPALFPASLVLSDIANDTNILTQYEIDTNTAFNSPALVSFKIKGAPSASATSERAHLKFNRKYYIRSRACHLRDTSKWSANNTFFTLTAPYFNEPMIPVSPDTFLPIQPITFKTYHTGKVTRFEFRFDTVETFNSPFLVQDTMTRNFSGAFKGITGIPVFGKRYYAAMRTLTPGDTTDWYVKVYHTQPWLKIYSPVNNSINLSSSLNLTWQEVSAPDLYRYEIESDTTPDFSSPLRELVQLPVFLPSYLLSDLYFNQKYYWRVRAVFQTGESPWTPVYNFKTGPHTTFLQVPYNMAMDVDVNPTEFSWLEVGGARGYHLSFDTLTTFATAQNRYVESGLSNFIRIYGLQKARRYYARIRSYNASDTSDWYTVNSFLTAETSMAPDSPALIAPGNNARLSSNRTNVALQWGYMGTNFYYELEVSKFPDFLTLLFPRVSTSSPSYYMANLQTLERNTRFYWRVRAITDGYTSSWSAVYNFMLLGEFYAPYDLFPDHYLLISPLYTALFWSPVSYAMGYEYQLDLDDDFTGVPVKFSQGNYSEVRRLQVDRAYFWRVRAIYQDTVSAWSDVARFRAGSLAAGETSEQPGSFIYPNPVTGSDLYISEKLRVKQVQVFDMYGRMHLDRAGELADNRIDVSLLPQGMYTIRVFSGDRIFSNKFTRN